MNKTAEMINSALSQKGIRKTSLQGVFQTGIPTVFIYKETKGHPPTPAYYTKGIVIVGQGQKTLYFEEKKLVYDEDNYIVFSLPIPVISEIHATVGNPHLSLIIDFDLGDLRHVVDVMEDYSSQFSLEKENNQPGYFLSTMSTELRETVHRLLKVLHSPVECNLMGKGLIKEILYIVLCSENASSLLSLIEKKSSLSRIEKAVKNIHANYSKPISVEELAKLVNMSSSAFYRAFRDVTATSPIQYIKKTRLSRARELILENRLRVGEAAYEVGYESVPQFSREFKRYFGNSPAEFLRLQR